jgi:hypothetical protein
LLFRGGIAGRIYKRLKIQPFYAPSEMRCSPVTAGSGR